MELPKLPVKLTRKRTRAEAFGIAIPQKGEKRLRVVPQTRRPEPHSPRLTSEERQILRSKREVEEIKEQSSKWAHFYQTNILGASTKLNLSNTRSQPQRS